MQHETMMFGLSGEAEPFPELHAVQEGLPGNRRGRTMKLGKGERIQVLDSETQLRLRKCRCQKFVWVGCLPYSLFSSHTCASFTVLCLHPEKAVHFLLASLTSYVEVVVWLFLLNLLLSGLKTRLLFSVHFFFCW